MCAAVANFSLKRSVVLHNNLHRFRDGRRMRTATLEAKLANSWTRLHMIPFSNFSRRSQGIRLTGQRPVLGNLEKVWSGSESGPPPHHILELPGNYPIFTVVMIIYHYVGGIWRILVTPNFLYKIYNHE